MISPGLAILPCLWVVWTFISVIIIYTMTVVEHHYHTLFISISDTGAKFPESIVLTVVSTISNLLEAAVVYVLYKLIEIRSNEMKTYGAICRKLLLALGWIPCVGNLINIYVQVPYVSDSINMAAFTCAGLYSIFLAAPMYTASRDSRCVRVFGAVLSVFMFLAFIGTLACKAASINCASRYCIQSTKTGQIILEWLILFGSCIGHIMLYQDFQVLTIRFSKTLKTDWIIMRDHGGETSSTNKESEPDPEKVET